VTPKKDIEQNLIGLPVRALVKRTPPNPDAKRVQKYSVTNPHYTEEDAILVIGRVGIDHIVVD
jgi:hypothetical protein